MLLAEGLEIPSCNTAPQNETCVRVPVGFFCKLVQDAWAFFSLA